MEGPWHAPGYAYAYLDPHDPLVTPPDAGINAWYARIVAVLRRSGGALLAIIALTQLAPATAMTLIGLEYGDRFAATPLTQPGAETLPPEQVGREFERLTIDLGQYLGIVLAAALLLSLLQALGYAAATWMLVRAAAGEPAGLGGAFRYGARRMVGLWGWILLSGLIITVGICLCVLPALYFAYALALAGPVYLFERGAAEHGNPVGRSWRLTHANVGAVLGRIVLMAAVVMGGEIVLSMMQTVVLKVAGVEPGWSPLALALALASVVISLPLTVVQVVALVVTYAEQRAREVPLNTRALLAALD